MSQNSRKLCFDSLTLQQATKHKINKDGSCCVSLYTSICIANDFEFYSQLLRNYPRFYGQTRAFFLVCFNSINFGTSLVAVNFLSRVGETRYSRIYFVWLLVIPLQALPLLYRIMHMVHLKPHKCIEQ